MRQRRLVHTLCSLAFGLLLLAGCGSAGPPGAPPETAEVAAPSASPAATSTGPRSPTPDEAPIIIGDTIDPNATPHVTAPPPPPALAGRLDRPPEGKYLFIKYQMSSSHSGTLPANTREEPESIVDYAYGYDFNPRTGSLRPEGGMSPGGVTFDLAPEEWGFLGGADGYEIETLAGFPHELTFVLQVGVDPQGYHQLRHVDVHLLGVDDAGTVEASVDGERVTIPGDGKSWRRTFSQEFKTDTADATFNGTLTLNNYGWHDRSGIKSTTVSMVGTRDGGQSWSVLYEGSGATGGFNALSCPAEQVCLGTGGPPMSEETRELLLATTDGGATWQQRPIVGQGGIMKLRCVDALTCVGATGYQYPILSTTDGGQFWQEHGYGLDIGGFDGPRGLDCPSATICFAVGEEGAIVGTHDGQEWRELSSGTISWLQDISCPDAQTCYVAAMGEPRAHQASVLISNDSGQSWREIELKTSIDSVWSIDCPSATTCYLQGDNGIVKTADGGATWAELTGEDSFSLSSGGLICPTEQSCFATGWQTLMATLDGGQTWREIYQAKGGYIGGLDCPTPQTCYVVGSDLSTTPGTGQSWTLTSQALATEGAPTAVVPRSPTPLVAARPAKATPVAAGTPVPRPGAPIGEATLGRLDKLASWGLGYGYHLAWAPDGRLAVYSSQGQLHVYDGQSHAELARFSGPASQIAISPDGATVAAGLYPADVGIWRLSDGTLLKKFKGHTDYVTVVAFSPDGQMLTSGSADGTVKLWKVADGTLLQTLAGHTEDASAVAFSPDGGMLASAAGRDGRIRLWRVADGTLLRSLESQEEHVGSLAFSPDGQTLASGGWDGIARLWRVADGTEIRSLSQDGSLPGGDVSVAISPDGQTLAVASDNAVGLFRISDGQRLRSLGPYGDGYYSMEPAFSPDGQTLAVSNSGSAVMLWRVVDGALLYSFDQHQGALDALALSPDGELAALGMGDGSVRLARMRDGTTVRALKGHAKDVSALAFSPDGQLLATGSWDNTIRLWRVADGAELWSIDAPMEPGVQIVFSPDGQTIAAPYVAPDGTVAESGVRLWRVSDGQLVRSLGDTRVDSLAFSPDGQLLALGSVFLEVQIWHVGDGTLVRTIELEEDDEAGSASLVLFTPDGRQLLHANEVRMRVYNLEDGTFARMIEAGMGWDGEVSFSPDGQLLASTADWEGVLILRYSDGALLRKLDDSEAGSALHVAFSPDGTTLAVGLVDGVVQLWGVPE